MDIKISPQSPDGLNITIENIIVDTYAEALEIIESIDNILRQKKEDFIKEVIHTPIKEYED